MLDKELIETPTFRAADLKKVPSIDPSEVDVYRLASNVSEMKQELNDLREVVQLVSVQRDSPVIANNEQSKAEHEALKEHVREVKETVNSLVQKATVLLPPEYAAESSGCDTPSNDEPPIADERIKLSKRYSDLPLFRTKDASGEWYTVAPKKKHPELPRRIIGATTSDSVKPRMLMNEHNEIVDIFYFD